MQTPNPAPARSALRRWVVNGLRASLVLLALAGLLVGALWLYFHPAHTLQKGIRYGERHGVPLSFDVATPSRTNGLGVLLMMSGGWKSGTNKFAAWMVAPLLRRGYTVFAVAHVSQPKATVMEIFDDVSRAARFIRHHAGQYGIDPRRMGVTGGSAGGHLSLMLATRGSEGPVDALDPVDRESSAVQAVGIFYPVTDLLNLGDSTENLGDGGPPKSFVKAFGPQSTNLVVWKQIGRDMSPIFHVRSNLAPTLILHGDADTLTPLDQSIRYQTAARAVGGQVEVRVHPGGGHGWLTLPLDVRELADWFDTHLKQSP